MRRASTRLARNDSVQLALEILEDRLPVSETVGMALAAAALSGAGAAPAAPAAVAASPHRSAFSRSSDHSAGAGPSVLSLALQGRFSSGPAVRS